ncbi:MAG: hypothetical protein RI556_01505 [Hydrogenovibrio sp.]|uniref:hypothetical protein n=1 Tax=Hydrogenovibrio sp. TaxID=2065821 RepID=UPI00287078D2|nr:hypothetical protein [Hydrogenovibrio sp.]MDR9497824.1 hypothetical protein [Hydrogenovibrio sp.]
MSVKTGLLWLLMVLFIAGGTFALMESLAPPEPTQLEREQARETIHEEESVAVESTPQREEAEVTASEERSTDEQPLSNADREKDQQTQTLGEEAPEDLSESREQAQAQLDESKERMERIRQIRSDLSKQMQKDPQSVNPEQVDELLAELEAQSEDGVVGGVNISQLRKIVQQSSQILKLSQGADEQSFGTDRAEKLKQEVKELQSLQSGILVNQPQSQEPPEEQP